MKTLFTKLALVLLVCIASLGLNAQSHSIARTWNEVHLEAIRGDFARPTVTARNLHHITAAMYDAWAVYEGIGRPYFLNNTISGFFIPFVGPAPFTDTLAAQEMAISFAAYRLLELRYFWFTPGGLDTKALADSVMASRGYDVTITSVDYSLGPAQLGNYIANLINIFGSFDGSNYPTYSSLYYDPINPAMEPANPGNPTILYLNRWQPLTLDSFVDQNGFPQPVTPGFQSPEWGNVVPFSLDSSALTTQMRDGDSWNLYHDPGVPPYLDSLGGGSSEYYQEGFTMVSKWGSHLDPSDSVMWDISPASIGKVNIADMPADFTTFSSFYDMDSGGVFPSVGRNVNPVTGLPYTPQIVPRGDYTRVLAEFWADGPDSETPPGHWFSILNYANDHPMMERRWNGSGPLMDTLDWDIVCYFTLGGAMHDAAIAAWAAKGYYDYIRPISAIRCMADIGQCTDTSLTNFNPAGIPLEPGFVEIVMPGDPLEGDSAEHVGKIKLYTWRGHDFVTDPLTDVAGVGWILAENWWPYQRPTFVTPPFAGYVSGHSTYSRAAATVLTQVTGTPYFPGGIGEFHCEANEFLVFEEGPSVDITLQWATYRDAADECSLSRIWGGIHPPADDIPGRKLGKIVGQNAYAYARDFIFNPCTDDADSDGICDAEDDCFGPNMTISSITPIDESACKANDAGLEIVWEGGAGDFNFTVNGLYTVGPFSASPQTVIGARKGIPVNTLTITDLATGCTVTDTLGIVLGGPDKPEIASVTTEPGCFGDGTVTVDVDDAAPGFGDYFARMNGVIYGPFTSEPFSFTAPLGTYTSVTMKDDNNCVDKVVGSFIVDDTCVLRAGAILDGEPVLIPNPAGAYTYLDLGSAEDYTNATVELMDVQGKLIRQYAYEGTPLRIELLGLPNGTYTIRWNTPAGMSGSMRLVHMER